MSFNRTKYDECALNLDAKRSSDQLDYRIFGASAENCNQCINVDGTLSRSGGSTSKKQEDLKWGEMADTESVLSWRHNQLSKCNDNNNNWSKRPLNHKAVCSNKLVAEDTRFTHPLDDYRCMSLTDLMISPYLPVNSQCIIQEDRTGLDTKLVAKDHYRVPKQQYWDKGEALPKSSPAMEQNGRWVFILDAPKIIN